MLPQRKSMKPAQSSSMVKAGLPVPIVICCIAFILFLIAATIVLSLIPIYVTPAPVQINIASTKSSPVTMQMNTGIVLNARRKRDSNSSSSDLQNHIGEKFGQAGIAQFKGQLDPLLAGVTTNSDGLSGISVTIGVSYNRKKRGAIKKRAIGYIILIIEFTVIFKPKCIGKCQTDTGNSIRTLLPSKVTVNTVVLTNIVLVDVSGQPTGTIAAVPVL
ncbi:unnamed protein product, partial [Rotaria magnacalcarata]